jgi:hypothetical protein
LRDLSAAVFIVFVRTANWCATNAGASTEVDRFAIAVADAGCLFAGNPGGLETTAAGGFE